MELLLSLGASSTSVSAGAGHAGVEGAILRSSPRDSTPLWENATVSAIFEAGADFRRVGDIVRDAFDLPAVPRLDPEPLEDRDWVEHVQRSWKPIALGRGFQVLLPWHEGPEGGTEGAGGRTVLRLEGGEAFGLGDHPTTQGATAFLERAVPRAAGSGAAPAVLDYGSGSGVLSIAAHCLGARAALGVEVDPRSVAAATRNAALNPLRGGGAASAPEFRLGPESFAEAATFAEELARKRGRFDVVVANILRRPLEGLAPALATLAGPGARLGLTGLRGELGDFEAVVAAYGSQFGDFSRVELEQGWLLVEATRL